MPLIGDELRTILGMMPTRDRAGIARGTMADDAVRSSAAADSGNAEGAALMQQGGAPRPAGPPQIQLPKMGGPGGPPPGDIQLPANVPTAFASGRGDGGAPPAPQERVVASGPAAAPPAKVATKASDVMIAALERQQRQQKMMQLVGSLGLIANAFNRNPTSAAATRGSLADMVGGGGGGGGGGNDLATIKAISDMKEKEDAAAANAQARTQAIGALRARGVSAEEAAVEVDSGQYKQRIGAEADEKERARATTESVKAKLRPKIKELATISGSDPDVLASQLETDPSKVFEIMTPKQLADVQKTLSDTDKIKFENLQTSANMTSWANARKNPEEYMRRYNLTPEQAAPMLDDFGAFREHLKNSTPMHDELQRKVRDINAERVAAGKPKLSTEEVAVLQVPKTLPTAAEKGEEATVKHLSEGLAKEHERVSAVHRDLTQNQPMAQELFNETQVGGSKLSAMTIAGRKLLGAMFLKPGEYDEKVVQSETFFNHIGENVLRRAKEFPGALSNDDRAFLEKLSGNIEMSPQSIRRLMIIREKMGKGELDNFNKTVAGHLTSASEGMKGAAKPYMRKDEKGADKQPFDMPEPGKFIQEDFARSGGPELLKAAAAAGKIGEPEFVRKFEANFGTHSLPFFREKAGV
jgi:hypothetical protein